MSESTKPVWRLSEQEVADEAMQAHFETAGDWPAVARRMIALLGDNAAHVRIDHMRETIKAQGIEVSNLTHATIELREQVGRLEGVKALLNIEILQLRSQLKAEQDRGDGLRHHLASALKAPAL